MDTPRSTRLARGIERDGEEARGLWEQEWMPAEDQYVKEHCPYEIADLIVDGSGTLVDISTNWIHVVEERR